MSTFSEVAQWVNVQKFANTDFIVCDKTLATVTATESLIVGDYIFVNSSCASGNVISVSGSQIEIAAISSTQFAESDVYTVTHSGSPYTGTLSEVSTTHGTHNESLANLADRTRWLKDFGGGSLDYTGSSLSLMAGDGSTTLSTVNINHTLTACGGTIYILNQNGVTVSEVSQGETLPIGTIIAVATTSVQPGFFLCNGDVIDISLYPELANKIYVGDANNNTVSWGYKTNQFDTARSISGTHIKLPDLSGLFLRGYDEAGTVDADRGGVWASYQDDELESHKHSLTAKWSGGSTYELPPSDASGGDATLWTNDTGGNETRPKNTVVSYQIKAYTGQTELSTAVYDQLVADVSSLSANTWNNITCPACLASSGYQVFNTGIIIQWGNVTVPKNDYADFTFPLAFPTSARSVVASPHRAYSGIIETGIMVHSYTSTYTRIYNQAIGDGGGTRYDYVCRIIAIGY